MKRFEPDSTLQKLIVELYGAGLSIASTRRELIDRDIFVTESAISSVLKTANLLRNARQLKGARIKPVYRCVKRCVYCDEEFNQAFARHVFCDACAPNGKFSKYIRKYGIGKREFDVMVNDQQGCCAICRKRLDLAKDTHVDHDHMSKAVRGLLCNVCNTRVGIYESCAESISSYLSRCKDYRF